ncbi:MAG TPA: CRISPR-associated helicase/endonuclease Cas3, partial [Rhodospirillum rubrum]|nr:CRISPR-associated helicase/endonuclease Cas3 [Rhodospirillum rubrum]
MCIRDRNHANPFSPAALEDYFREVYWSKGPGLDEHKILKAFAWDRSGGTLNYKRVAEDFRMIDSGMAPVIIGRDAQARAALALLGRPDARAGQVARLLQPYLVQVPPPARMALITNGHVRFAEERSFGDQFAVLTADSLYRDDTGLLWEDAGYLDLEQSIF